MVVLVEQPTSDIADAGRNMDVRSFLPQTEAGADTEHESQGLDDESLDTKISVHDEPAEDDLHLGHATAGGGEVECRRRIVVAVSDALLLRVELQRVFPGISVEVLIQHGEPNDRWDNGARHQGQTTRQQGERHDGYNKGTVVDPDVGSLRRTDRLGPGGPVIAAMH